MKIMGKEVTVRTKSCQGANIEPYVNLYVRLGNVCNVRCRFCTFCGPDTVDFDLYKLLYCIQSIRRDVKIAKVSFTGGEPTLYHDKLNSALTEVKNIDPSIFTVLSTNGCFLEKVNESLVDSIALSRHSKHDAGAREIMQCQDLDFPIYAALTSFRQEIKKKIHVTCNLIAEKGYVWDAESAAEYLEVMSAAGYSDFGFVGLMQVNNFCKQHRVPTDRFLNDLRDSKRFYETRTGANEAKTCTCSNFLYRDRVGQISRIYVRDNTDTSVCENTLVYDVNELKIGFGGEIIV